MKERSSGCTKLALGTGMTRRAFLRDTLAASALMAGGPLLCRGEHAGRASKPAHWFESAWRRAVIDMHIPDWDPAFLSKFDPDQYVDALVRSRAQSIVCYAQSHVGLFNYPTKIGKQHAGLNGRDIVGEMIERCHRRNIAVVLYTSLIHDRWAFDTHPDWRMKNGRGEDLRPNQRFGVVCPNSPYREYVREWVKEIGGRFDFEGMRFDMTFWPNVCYCKHCEARWQAENGGEIPRRIDWTDERWVAFQHKREEWLAEFASIATSTVRELKPSATVEHQASTIPIGWWVGVSHGLVPQNDFLQGDFYGDALQGSFVRKLLSELTPNRPFGFETSFSVELRDHTGPKSEELLEAKASAAIGDAAAFIFIDAIDPIGTVNPAVHDRMGRVFGRLLPYYAELGGDRVAEIAIYYSLDSKFDMRDIGRQVAEGGYNDTHTPAAMNAARWLIQNHLPFTVVTRKNLGQLGRFKVLILSNVHHLSKEECEALREFVRLGGGLYASGGSSLVESNGRRHADFQLADVFGVSCVKADWSEREHYISPVEAGAAYFPGWSEKYPAFLKGYGFEVKAHAGAEVLARSTLGWPGNEPGKFSSIHSNPPWVATENPEVVLNPFGAGRAIYCSSVLENVEGLRDTFIRLIRALHPVFAMEAEGAGVVEATLFHQPEQRRYLLSLVNFQRDLPNIPVENFRVHLRLRERIREARSISPKRKVKLERRENVVTFVSPRIETLQQIALNYG